MNGNGKTHDFHPLAFVENLFIKDLAASYPEARRTAHELAFEAAAGVTVFMYPFGSVVLDKPDALWDDAGAEVIDEQLQPEFDLIDRDKALELRLRSVQEALELVTDVARGRQMVFREASIVLLIVPKIVLSLVGRH